MRGGSVVTFLAAVLFLLAAAEKKKKILVYNPKFGHSHSNYMGLVADTLVDAGHDVTSLIPLIDPVLKDGTTRSRVLHVPQDPVAAAQLNDVLKGEGLDFWELEEGLIMAFMMNRMFRTLFCSQCKTTLNHPGLIDQLTKEKYDVFITETFDNCGLGLSHAIGAKSLIIVSSSSLHDNAAEHIGVPIVPSFNPSFSTHRLDLDSFWSRANNAYRTALNYYMFEGSLECSQECFVDKFGRDFPSIKELSSHAAFAFTNSEPFLDFARPLLRKVVDIGGIGVKDASPVDEYWSKIFSLRNRTVLVSFGSMAKSALMSPQRKHAMITTLSRFPDVTFIWKYETPEDDFAKNTVGKVKNVVLSKWTPQNDLLNDPRLTAFISHAGMGSCQEVATRGVPTLFIPIFGDQPRNAAMMEFNGVGLALSKHDATDVDKLTAAVRRLLGTEELRRAAKKMSAMLARRPFTPQELLARHVEFAAEFGEPRALRPRGLELSLLQYYLVDVIALGLVLLLLTIMVLVFITTRFLRHIFIRPGKQEKSKKA